MENSVAALSPDEFKHLVREALRETLYLAFDRLDSGDEISLKDFAALLAEAARSEASETQRVVRERLAGAVYRTAEGQRIGDYTPAELEALIADTIRDSLPALLLDPDWGLELRSDVAEALRGSASEPPLSLEDVKAKLRARE